MNESNAVVIGMGFLATYVLPCYKRLFGEELSGKMVGIKGSTRGLKEKQEECGFPVTTGSALPVLLEKRPDIIFIGVKPHQVAGVVAESLKPYYEKLREEGAKFPDLYSFAPDPVVSYYYEQLGDDIHAVNMIPNMVSVLQGINVAKIGCNYVAFDKRDNWTAENRQRAKDFLLPVGSVVEVDGEKAIEFLSTQVTCHLMFEHTYIVQDVMREFGKELTLPEIAMAYRTAIHRFFDDPATDILPSGTEAVGSQLYEFMKIQMEAFYQGICDFGAEEGLPASSVERMVCGTMETYMMEPQLETRDILLLNTRNHATPGGFLEMCMKSFGTFGYGFAEDALRRWMKGEAVPELYDVTRKVSRDVTRAISDHGKTTSGIKTGA